MTEAVSRVVALSLRACPGILLLMAARLLLRRAPAVLWRPLWWAAFFRLIWPFLYPVPIPVPRATVLGRVAMGVSEALILPGGRVLMPRPETPPEFRFSVGDALAVVWLLGFAAMLCYELASYLRFRRCLTGAVRLRGNIYLGDHLPAPVTVGLLPRILLPSSLEEPERDLVILHERCHIRWGDHLFKPLACLLLAIHWFNPLVWLAYYWACRDLESACDQGALAKAGGELRQRYASALLRLSTGGQTSLTGPLSFGAGAVKDRIRRVMAYRKIPPWASALAGLLAAAVICVAILTPFPHVQAVETSLDFTPYDSFFYTLQPGEAAVYPEVIRLTETANLHYTATWTPTGLGIEAVLTTEDGAAMGSEPLYLEEGIGGVLTGVFSAVPPGEYRFVLRNSSKNQEYAPTTDREALTVTGAAAFGWWEAGAWKQVELPREGTIRFPAYQDGRADYNAAVYDIAPFRAALTLPEGWSVRMPPAEERRTSYAFTPLYLYQGEEYAGSIAYNTFEVYPDVPPENFYRMVYNQLMLGSVVNWDNDYTVVRQWPSGCSATVQVMEQEAAGAVYHPGILAYDRDLLVYVAIELEEGRLSRQEIWELAESLELLPEAG